MSEYISIRFEDYFCPKCGGLHTLPGYLVLPQEHLRWCLCNINDLYRLFSDADKYFNHIEDDEEGKEPEHKWSQFPRAGMEYIQVHCTSLTTNDFKIYTGVRYPDGYIRVDLAYPQIFPSEERLVEVFKEFYTKAARVIYFERATDEEEKKTA